MSDVSVDIIKNRSGEAPDLPSGANLSGVSTAATLQVTNLNPTHINASGVTTATTFSGSMKSTGTPTLGLGVTINSSGLNISGVATAGIVSATTLYGDGSNLTGVAMSIAPISYQPDVNDTSVTKSSVSIGITFTERVIAGSGNVTLRIAGAAGTVVENFGVGSSVTINNNEVSVTPTAALIKDTVYHINYPSGSFTNTGGDVSYVGTAYTFTAAQTFERLYVWGDNREGQLGQNNETRYSSPVQLGTDTDWKRYKLITGRASFGIKNSGELWVWGNNHKGILGNNSNHDDGATSYSSPIQLPGTTWDKFIGNTSETSGAIKTDGTLWTWGGNQHGQLGKNNRTAYSSPVQVGSDTTWSDGGISNTTAGVIKTDGTLWTWGQNAQGNLGLNQAPAQLAYASSPVQIPGTSWTKAYIGPYRRGAAIRTDGTLWTWGLNQYGQLGLNNTTVYSSPVQIPGTTWKNMAVSSYNTLATKTNGTLWAWGRNAYGDLGQNNTVQYSSPTQISGTTWDFVTNFGSGGLARKTDGTVWIWGKNEFGGSGMNVHQHVISSPVQLPGTTWGTEVSDYGGNYSSDDGYGAIKVE